MALLSKADFNYTYEDFDYSIVSNYLQEVFKRSTSAYKNQKAIILNLLNHLNKPLQKITMLDIKTYFEKTIDTRINKRNNNPISIDSKKAYRSYLHSFFDYTIGRLLEINVEYRNPVPSKGIYKFTRYESDIKKQSETNEEHFTEKEMLELLNFSKKKSLRDFILFSLLVIDGARISEILTIKIPNINLESRYFETGFEKDARKSTRFSKKKLSLVFFFPDNFRPYLEQYMNYIGKDNIWLFPGRSSHFTYSGVRDYVMDNYEKKYRRFHQFRGTLINNRLIKMKCPLWISEGLMNHKISNSTQIKHYANLTIEQKRDLYDEYFPYYSFPYF